MLKRYENKYTVRDVQVNIRSVVHACSRLDLLIAHIDVLSSICVYCLVKVDILTLPIHHHQTENTELKYTIIKLKISK